MVRLGQHLEHRARDPVLLFDRLVRVGVRAERHRVDLVARSRQLAPQQSAAFGLAKSFVSKSSPGDNPWYAWVGLAKQYTQPCSQPR
jgi:hypothetical protein